MLYGYVFQICQKKNLTPWNGSCGFAVNSKESSFSYVKYWMSLAHRSFSSVEFDAASDDCPVPSSAARPEAFLGEIFKTSRCIIMWVQPIQKLWVWCAFLITAVQLCTGNPKMRNIGYPVHTVDRGPCLGNLCQYGPSDRTRWNAKNRFCPKPVPDYRNINVCQNRDGGFFWRFSMCQLLQVSGYRDAADSTVWLQNLWTAGICPSTGQVLGPVTSCWYGSAKNYVGIVLKWENMETSTTRLFLDCHNCPKKELL